jgi:hypothetical protein
MSQPSSAENKQSGLQPVFDLLNKVATERKEGCFRVCEVLALDPTVSRFLQEQENKPIAKPFSTLWENVSKIVKDSAVKRTIADWPFENFWGNPDEPKHSKMLAHFIDPDEKHGHGYGKSFLKELLKVCGKTDLVVDDHCEVKSERDHIDILVIRKAQDGENKDSNNNYAIIFENKIHGAIDQPGAEGTRGQLDTYVEVINKKFKFEYTDIHVFYLPLRADKDPDSVDKKAIIGKVGDNNYKKITFETEILRWLKNATDGKTAALKDEGMRANLNHYKNLITYLINKNKESNMKIEILKQLENGNVVLPSLEAARRAQEAVNELVPCLEIHKTLKAVEAEIRQQEPQTEIEMNFPFDDGIAVGLKVSGGEAIFWFGRDHDEDQWFFAYQRGGEKSLCPESFDQKCCWHGDEHFPYKLAREVLDECNFNTLDLSQEDAKKTANKLLDLRDSLMNRLNPEKHITG